MPAKKLFKTQRGRTAPPTNTVNEAGGVAYKFTDKHALAQFAMTGTLPEGGTFYQSGENELAKMLALAAVNTPEYVAKTAVYARENGGMKDAPALLLAHLTSRDADGRSWFNRAFGRVVTNGKMLLGFTQIMRSGAVGRKSLGAVPKKAIRDWLRSRTGDQLFGDSVGGSAKGTVSLSDVIKMVHPTPRTAEERAIFAYLIGKCPRTLGEAKALCANRPELAPDWDKLPKCIRDYETFKAALLAGESAPLPKGVRWEFLSSLPLKEEHWRQLALRGGWRQTLKNLNTYKRQGVFSNEKAVKAIAEKLRDKEEIQERVKPFPYEIKTAYDFVHTEVPEAIRDALHDAMDLATSNMIGIDGALLIAPDLSGSMDAPVTGYRGSATTKATCADISSLLAAILYKRNMGSTVMPFANDVLPVKLERRDSILTLTNAIRHAGGGGTCISAPLARVNRAQQKINRVVIISDNESWVDSRGRTVRNGGTELMAQFNALRSRCPGARMVCLDLAANDSTQAPEGDADILNIGGWSNAVWSVIIDFLNNGVKPGTETKTATAKPEKDVSVWVREIEAIDLAAACKSASDAAPDEAEEASE